MVQSTRTLLKLDPISEDVETADLWGDFELSEWNRTRLRLTEDHLHALPHTGDCKRTLSGGGEELSSLNEELLVTL